MAFVSVKTGEKVKLQTGYTSNPIDYRTWEKQQAAKRAEGKPSAVDSTTSAKAKRDTATAAANRAPVQRWENQVRQAQVDLDTDVILRLNKKLKEERARQGKQTLGDRASDVASAVFGGSGSSFANLAGFASNLVQDPEHNRRQIARLRDSLSTGRTTDGRPISDAQRRTIQESISKLEASAEKWEAPDSFTNRVYQAADRMADTGAAFQESAKAGLGKVGSTIVDAATSMGQSTLDAALGAVTGTGMLPFVARSVGGGTQEARRGGADLDEQQLYGSAQAAKEYVTEKLFGLSAPQRLIGGGSFDDAIEKGIRKATERLAKTPGGQKLVGGLMTWLAGGATEGLEEGIGSVIENALINPNLRDWDPDQRTVEEKISDGLYEMLVGGVSGLMGVTNLARYQVSPQSGPDAHVRGVLEMMNRAAGREAAQTAQDARQAAGQGTDTPQAQNAAEAAQTGSGDVLTEAGQTAPPADVSKLDTSNSQGETVRVIKRLQESLPSLSGKAPVAFTSLNSVQNVPGDTIAKKARTLFDAIKGAVSRPGFGEIEINTRSAKDDLSHGVGPAKAAVIPAIPEILRSGTQIDFQKNWKGRPYDGYVFAAPVVLDGKMVFVAAVVKQTSKNRFYLHEVVDSDGNIIKIDNGAQANPTSLAADSGAGAQTPSSKEKTRTTRDTMPGANESAVPVINAQGEPPQSSSMASTIPQGADSVKPEGIMEQELRRLFGGGKRLSPDTLTAEQLSAVEAANDQGTVDMDAENRLYQVDPGEHIDRRDVQSAGDKRVRAFQFDHPQLHPYYVRAAEALAAELEHYIPGGETASRVSEDGNAYSYRMGRAATPRIAELIDHYGVKPSQIGRAIEAIIQDRGQENFAAAKRLELLLDDMLSGGYQDISTGETFGPNREYLELKGQIAGAIDTQQDVGHGLDGLGAADAGFSTRGMEGRERTSRMAQSHPYNKAQEAATAMTKDEYNRLFRYQSQTEAKTTHLAEELVYVLQNGKKTFLKDVNEAQYKALLESLRDATAWNAEQTDAAKMIELELLGRSVNGEITSEEYTDWLNTIREHGTSTGQGIQALAKWTRTDNNRGQASASQAVETIQKSNLSEARKKALAQEVLGFTKRINDVQEGDTRQLQDIILDISKKRGTTTGPVAKRLDGVLRKAMDGLTFQELKQFAFSSTESLSTDAKPLDAGEAAKTIQVLNMLSSLKTPGRNLTGNTAFYALDALSTDGAALLDMALSNITGTRSVAMGGSPINRAMWENALKSARMSALETALDVDMGSGETMYGTGGQRTFRAGAQHEGRGGKAFNFTERMLSALERNNSFLLTVPDEFFKGLARGNEARIQSLIDQGKIKTGDANYAAKQADAMAKYRTFQDTNAASAISSGIHDLLNLIGKGDSGKKIKGLTVHSFGLGDFASPFSRVAANLAARGGDYNPVTAIRGVVEMGSILYDAKRGKTIDPARQAKAVSHTARGISGTAIIGAFLALLSGGLIRRADDEGDENVAALNRSEGRTGYQFNLSAAGRWMDGESQKWRNGDKLLDISSLQPFNELLGVADQIYHDEEKTPKSLFKDDLLGLMYAAADIPVLQTAGDLAKDLTLYKKDPLQAFSEAAVNTAVSSVTPNILRSVAQGLDDRPRSIDREDGLWKLIQEEAKSRVPGLRQTLRGSVDPTGEDKTYPGSRLGNFFNSTVNPMGLNTYQQTEQSREWQRLREETGRTDFYPSNRIPKKLKGNGLSKDLSYEERQDFQRERGAWLMPVTMQMMGNQGYKRAGSEQQSDLLADVRSFANSAAKLGVLGKDSVSKWVSEAIQAQKETGLSPAAVIYYKDLLNREKENRSAREANQAVRSAIYMDSSMNTAQKNALDNIVLSDVVVMPQEKNVNYSDEDSFHVTQLSDSAVKHWNLVHEKMPGITGEQYGTAWEISNRKKPDGKGYSKEDKLRFLREELDLTAGEAKRLYGLMKEKIEDE